MTTPTDRPPLPETVIRRGADTTSTHGMPTRPVATTRKEE